MLRGNNKQVIFEYENDYLRFQQLMYQKCNPKDVVGNPMPPCCVIYAYCLMPNHVHLLLQEKQKTLGEVMKRITIAYAYYFNRKYQRNGYLFQDRFRSEPVDDAGYFIKLMAYIHLNPVNACIVSAPGEYPWSSWSEYENLRCCPMPFCAVSSVLSRISWEALNELVNEPLPKTSRILDYNNETTIRLNEEKIREFICKDCEFQNPKDIQTLSKPERKAVLKKILDFGGSIRQISRLTGLSESIVRRAR
jgi:REP element-mobilizing transposase RayT